MTPEYADAILMQYRLALRNAPPGKPPRFLVHGKGNKVLLDSTKDAITRESLMALGPEQGWAP